MPCLVLLSFFFTLLINTVNTNFFIIFLKSSQILTGLREFSFFHTLTNIPGNKGTLGIHQVKLVIKTSPGLCNGSRVAQHADGTLYFGQIPTRNNSGWLVVDANLEACGTPVNKLDGSLGFDSCYRSIDIFGYDIATIKETAGHVLAMTWVTFHHLIGWFKAGIGDLSHTQLLVVGFLCRDDRCIGSPH